MITKIGIIRTPNPSSYPAFFKDEDFAPITRCGIIYYKVLALSHYIDELPFDYRFDSEEAYQTWLTDFFYVIIPSELIPSLVDLSAFVEDIDVDNQFNVILSTTDITTRNAATYKVPCDVINMTPCKLLAWEAGDDTLLQGIIDVWNSQEDYRVIDFACKFDSYAELEAFKILQIV